MFKSIAHLHHFLICVCFDTIVLSSQNSFLGLISQANLSTAHLIAKLVMRGNFDQPDGFTFL